MRIVIAKPNIGSHSRLLRIALLLPFNFLSLNLCFSFNEKYVISIPYSRAAAKQGNELKNLRLLFSTLGFHKRSPVFRLLVQNAHQLDLLILHVCSNYTSHDVPHLNLFGVFYSKMTYRSLHGWLFNG